MSMNSEAYESIKALCYNRSELPHDKLLQQLESTLASDPGAVRLSDEKGWTLLHHAADQGRSDKFCLILMEHNVGALMTAITNDGELPIHLSCSRNHCWTTMLLYNMYPKSLLVEDKSGSLPIHRLLASENCDIYLLRCLLEKEQGALSQPDRDGQYPLHHACAGHSKDVVRMLFDAHPEAVYIKSDLGCTPLDKARDRWFFEDQLYWVDEAREVISQDDNGELPIHQALKDCCISLGAIKLMMKANPASISVVNSSGQTPLHIACQHLRLLRGDCPDRSVEIAKFLLELHPANVNVPDMTGMFPIHALLRIDYYKYDDDFRWSVEKLTELLIENDKAALSKRDNDGNLPLHLACERPSFHVVKLLFDAYPQAIYVENERKETPLAVAKGVRFPDDTGMILPGEEELEEMEEVLISFLESQLKLHRRAKKVTTPNEKGQLPIHQALQKDDTSLGAIKLMVAGNPASLTVADKHGIIPLHIACQVGNIDAIKILMEADKESLSISDAEGNFAIHHACRRGCDVANSILEQSTCGTSERNADGKLPIERLIYEAGDQKYVNTDNKKMYQEYTEAVYHLLQAHPEALKELSGQA